MASLTMSIATVIDTPRSLKTMESASQEFKPLCSAWHPVALGKPLLRIEVGVLPTVSGGGGYVPCSHRQRVDLSTRGQPRAGPSPYAGVGQKLGLKPVPPRGIPEVLPLRVMP
jgi:hypothetical protein